SPIQTHVVETTKPAWVDRTWQRNAEEVGKGHQAYVVCPKLGDPADPDAMDDADLEPPPEEDEAPRELTGVYAMAERLRAVPAFAGVRIEVLLGRLDPDVKDRTMRGFADGEIDVLVSTTVIEVGVDVPNASVMVVMDADRFGISQLHQLRGRVGRGAVPGLCLLVTDAAMGTAARDRLEAVAATTDGFELSRVDLEHRREGDVLGAAQSGRRSSLKLLSVLRDEDVIDAARNVAGDLVAADPELRDHPALRAVVDSVQESERADYLDKTC